ncbi:MAG TPA: ankyrin repeat domain-containing protein [Thermoanaerobaculia bacterium]|jgi:hypothetical protein
MTAGAIAGGASPVLSQAQPQSQPKIPDRGPRLDADLVREFVIAGHGNLDRTRELLEQQPALINATWDWGGGDWETALGGASHMGNKPIAEFLLSRGARMDVFCATMMGKVEIVKAFLADDPKVIDLKGPHGIPLIRHAQAGKQDAVVELLRAAGAKG